MPSGVRLPSCRLLMVALACCGVPALGGQEPAPSPAGAVAWATITSRSGELLYLEVGSRQGIREGSSLTVIRAGATIGHLTARYVSSNRTASSVVDTTTALVIGDSVRYVAVRVESAETPVAVASRPAARRRTPPVRGRLGIRYLMISQPSGMTMRQPAFDLRLTGTRIGGSSVGLAVDIRAQRTTVTTAGNGEPTPTSLTRVYQAAMNLQSASAGTRMALGRQYATTLSPIGIFDGLAVDLTGERWSAGLLAGTQPEAASLAPSRETTEFGLWLQRHNTPTAKTRWTTTLGAVGSYHLGEINREFAYLRATYAMPGLSIYAAQEIDANRGWRREAEGSAATLTSSFATIRLTVAEPLSLSAGIDSRRNIRLYRDQLNPEIVFDDASRQGHWGEVALSLLSNLRLTAGARQSTGGSAGGTHSVTASLHASRLTSLQLGLRLRTTRYAGPASEGTLASAMIEASPLRSVRLALNAGQRTTGMPGTTTRLTWLGSDVDIAVARSLYLMLSTYRESGSAAATTQNYLSISWRF